MEHFLLEDESNPDRVVRLPIRPGLTLAQHLYLAGALRRRALCSGAGRCGLCRTLFSKEAPSILPEETAILSPGLLEKGWRLSCRRQPAPGMVVRARIPETPGSPAPLPEVCPGAILGIDLGTTSMQWRFAHGGMRLSGGGMNPQLAAGSEVMSRLALAASPEGAATLRRDVADAVRGILAGLPCLPGSICMAGNTCMTYLALGLGVSGLSAAPYRMDWPGGDFALLDAGLPEVYIPPLLAPFVGGDVSAGLAALAFRPDPPEPPCLLADLGTNGEFALVLPGGGVLVASVPMGPALEGVGMAHGMIAGPGAAVAFQASPAGIAAERFGGGGEPLRGISGTGYVSLAALLVSLGAMDETGRFRARTGSPLAARVLGALRNEAGEPCLEVEGARLLASDVETLLKVKAAYCSAARILLDEAGLGFRDLSAVLLAGALGEHVKPSDLEVLGFFPPGGAARVRPVGNISLEGACLAAAGRDVREWLSGLTARTRLVEVVSRPGFQKMFIESMRFTHV
ncbi:MAG: ASKHA domain-containing protein [Thermodesulfobacteriota bacterium]